MSSLKSNSNTFKTYANHIPNQMYRRRLFQIIQKWRKSIRGSPCAKLLLPRFKTSNHQKKFDPISCIERIWFEPMPRDSPWVKPVRLKYIENEKEKYTDLIKTKDGVMVVLFNITRKKLIVVRQFRGAVYQGIYTSGKDAAPKGEADLEKFPPEIGITLELCGGAVDKDMSLVEIAREEVLEECGYDVHPDSIQLVFYYRSGIGTSSGRMAMYYCEVCDEQKITNGGGVENEVIQVVELSLSEAAKLVQTGATTNGGPTFLLALVWFFLNKASAYT
ncbi:uncharacterized protein Dana_GF27776 [Drosophila ananassae]|uniref:Uridine diphosphate glucose pyrophosphatase NUDT14 n=1 Tax=Drosophila ananassae TaxID=7217 RepID=A0A0P8Y2L6_DROAN|nr:uridine diphosphate glucose pyrophosphatase NUDT14 [Drosophila ananassae]KPU72847.1 uncharacterized protein Dana_GF27776 [Drosophila ananassae]